jgi:hypothetical protein
MTKQPSTKAPGRGETAAPVPAPDSALAGASDQAPIVLKTRHAAIRYTTLRLALFIAALVLVWGVAALAGMDLSSQLSKLVLVAVALFISSAGSFVLLSKQRDAMSAGLIARTERLGRKFDDAASFEDDEEGAEQAQDADANADDEDDAPAASAVGTEGVVEAGRAKKK